MALDRFPNGMGTLIDKFVSRRAFLRDATATTIAAGALAACKDAGKASGATPSGLQAPTKQGAPVVATPTGGTMGPHDTGSVQAATAAAEQMDKMHEAGVKAFPAKTAGKGNQPFAPRVENGVKIFELTAKKVRWETMPGLTVDAWVYNDQLPGPQIRVREGDRVRVILHNQLPESTAIHFHGVEVPNDQDGVPYITQPPVKSGQSYTYEFVAPNAGSHMYHSHHNSAKQVGLGLLGAFIIEPRAKGQYDSPDVDYVMILNDGAHGYTFNGKSFPATEPIVCKQGQTVRIRYMNEGMMIHPMHLHGMHQTVTHKDGWPLPQPYRCDTLNIAPGERWDVTVRANNPGTWAFHCHILPHAESDRGMFGMVTALVVQK
jgi:FtsP/CotA-like multicopper oxidase with cupredoxin domain